MKIFALLFCLLFASAAFGLSDRIAGAIDPDQAVALRGNVPPQTRAAIDLGRADRNDIVRRVTIHFRPAPALQMELDQLLADQQNPKSPYYHTWLTPEQFGDRFSLTAADQAKVLQWLKDAGLSINSVAAARNWIAVDGKVGDVERAFHTEIHNYRIDGGTHFANATEPSIPAAIAPFVTGISELTDFQLLAPPHRVHSTQKPDGTNNQGVHYLSPDDLAVIYDINPLYQEGYDGTGQTLVVLGGSNISESDIALFRSTFALPSINLTQILVPGSKDPGSVSDSEPEADLDLEWSGAVARNANIVYVYAQSNLTAFDYAVSPPVGSSLPGPLLSASFGSCEAQAGTLLATLQSEVDQANSEGVTIVNSSGDSGPAGCDPTQQSAAATMGESVEVPAALPGVTAVGGTEFNEGSGMYWNAINSTGYESALSYIPEAGWNASSPTNGLAASGGGASTYYGKPSWQNVTGVPTGSFRDVPDVAMAASGTHDYYIVITSANSSCSACPTGGTSASTPVFAGIIAILNQYAQAKGLGSGALGNINPTLYQLYTSTPNAFHDITEGNNIVACVISSLDCGNGSFGYSAGVGYDLVTGLGSVDAANLVTQWFGQSTTSTGMPVISTSGIVPVYSKATTVQPGEWASIYGFNLAPNTVTWNGNFPTMLANTTVTIDGEYAYLWYVSPRQINFQVPNDSNTGRAVAVVVTTPSGTAVSTVNLATFAPSFSLLDSKHIAGIILRTDGSGHYGNGTYDIIGPLGSSLGYPTVPVQAGDSVELFGVGFGPTNPVVLAGQPFSGSAPTLTSNPIQILINGLSVNPSFTGIVEAGLYQLNFTMPAGYGTGDVSIEGIVGGVTTPSGVVISLQ